jgi:hypothetical protein
MISQYFTRNSQPSIFLLKRDGAFDPGGLVENTNFTGMETRTTLSVIDCLALLWKHRLNAGSFKNLPAPTVRSDFNQRHCGWFVRVP